MKREVDRRTGAASLCPSKAAVQSISDHWSKQADVWALFERRRPAWFNWEVSENQEEPGGGAPGGSDSSW